MTLDHASRICRWSAASPLLQEEGVAFPIKEKEASTFPSVMLSPLLFAIEIIQWIRTHEFALWRTHQPFLAVGIIGRLADWIVGDNVDDEILGAVIGQLMRLVRSKDKCVAGFNRCRPIFVTNQANARNDVIQLPLRTVQMIWIRRLSRSQAQDFKIEWMSILQIG